MKKMKKLASILLAAIMVLAMAVPGMAADEVPGTVKGNVSAGDLSSHKFVAYQIFKGTPGAGGALGDIDWGEGVVPETFMTKLVEIGVLESGEEYSVLEVSEKIAEAGKVAETAKKIAQAAYDSTTAVKVESLTTTSDDTKLTVEGITAGGYYLIVDESDANSTFLNASLLQVSGQGEFEINVKTDKPSSEKKVKDINDSTDDAETEWQDSADYDIGDDVPFQLTGTLPQNFSDYETYTLVFHDKDEVGLQFNEGSVKVYVGDSRDAVDGGLYQVKTDDLNDGCSFEVIIPNVKALTGADNGVKIHVEYTSKLTKDAVFGALGNPNTMHMEYSNNPDVQGEGHTGTTPTDTVIVFTYKTGIDKIDQDEKELEGAEFTLEKYNKENSAWEEVGKKEGTKGSRFEFEGLDDGYYRLKETKTPAGYNSIDDIYFEVTATHTEGDSPTLTNLDAKQKAGTDTGISTEEFSGELTFGPTVSKEAGSIEADVKNQKGAVLPETGGIGTTIFYVLGSILVLGAVILLVTKRRMGAEK